MSVEYTVCEPWLEKHWLRGGHYFHAEDLIPASRDCTTENWIFGGEKKNKNANKMLLIVIINALNYELFIEMTGSLCKENSLLPPGYSFSCEI